MIVTYSDETTDIWTLKGNCAEPKVSAKGFIEGWGFTRDGGHVVIKSRGAHGPATIELFPLRNGPPAESVQAYEKNLPDWAAPFADTD